MKMSHNPRPAKLYGFRCSKYDIAVLVAAIGLALLLYSHGIGIWWIIPAVTGHFFLFCNVFLVWRRWELIWAGCFVVIVGWQMALGEFGWWPTLIYVFPVTISVIVLQLRSPWYHGIGARRLNPKLDDFLNKKLS